MAILGSGNDNINIDGATSEFVDFGGQDTYTILNTLSGDVIITDNDASTINLPVGLNLSNAEFLSDGVRFTINGFTVTLIGDPAQFSFIFGGTPLDTSAGTPLTLEEMAVAFGTTVPAQGEPTNSATITGGINADGSIGDGGTTPPDAPPLPEFLAIDDEFTVTEDTTTELNVLGNDTGSGISVTSFTNPQNGTLELDPIFGGRFLYTPDADFVGEDTFTYTSGDGFGQSGTATVTITVEDDDISGSIATPAQIGESGQITSEIEEGFFDADFFTYDISGSGGSFSLSLTGTGAAEAEFLLRDAGSDAYALSRSDDTLFFSADNGVTQLTIGVARDLDAPDIPGEDEYTFSIFEIFPPDELPASDETPMFVNLSGDGAWSTSDNRLSNLAAIEEAGDRDWIGFAADGFKDYRIQLQNSDPASATDFELVIRDSSGASVRSAVAFGDEDFVFSPDTGSLDQYFIEVYAYSLGTTLVGTYDLTVTEIV